MALGRGGIEGNLEKTPACRVKQFLKADRDEKDDFVTKGAESPSPRRLLQMNATSRCARRLLYRDFYELFPWFSTHAPKRILPSRSTVAVQNCTSRYVRRTIHIDAQASREGSFSEIEAIPNATRPLPAACPGCGALTQSVHKNEAGFYSSSRANVRRYTHPQPPEPSKTTEDAVVKSALANIPSELREQLGMDTLESSSGLQHQLLFLNVQN